MGGFFQGILLDAENKQVLRTTNGFAYFCRNKSRSNRRLSTAIWETYL